MAQTAITPGTYALGPDNGSLTVHTRRGGAAAKAAHDLTIEVGSWEATMTLADDPTEDRLALSAGSTSLRVREATGGMRSLDDDDRASIAQTIDEEVLKGTSIAFASTRVARGDDGRLTVEGELELAGTSKPVAFELGLADGRLAGRTTIKQTDWGIKPYSALFGTLKVKDEVDIAIDAALPEPAGRRGEAHG
ncbi:MAG: YceI family protein [Solirubrobacterales bacterium]|nr:YceI family protein [Solirubrobacterales bacterium]